MLYVDFKLDESYTPSKISIRAGDGFHNLKVSFSSSVLGVILSIIVKEIDTFTILNLVVSFGACLFDEITFICVLNFTYKSHKNNSSPGTHGFVIINLLSWYTLYN